MKFTEENILKVFGNEAAESEDPKNLRGYYFKSKIYEQVTSKVPLRLVVGHKGIGKSALFKVAGMEDEENGMVSVTIRPDDIISLATSSSENFLQLIRDWKDGLRQIIFSKIVEQFPYKEPRQKTALNSAGHIITLALASIKAVEKHLDLSEAKKRLLSRLADNCEANVYIDDLDRGWEAKKSISDVYRLY